MKEKIKKVLLLLVFLCLAGSIAFAVFLFYEKKEIKELSLSYLHQLNQWYHPNAIYDKKGTGLTDSDNDYIAEVLNDEVPRYVYKESDYYKRLCEDIKSVIEAEMEMAPEKRVKTMTEELVSVEESHISTDIASVSLIVEENSVKYDTSTGSTKTEYVFYYKKVNGKWKITNLGISYPDI